MNPDRPEKLVRCADEMRRIYCSGMRTKTLVILLIWGVFSAIGWSIHAEWPKVVGLLLAMAVVVLPQIVRIHRGYTRQLCPSCGRQVGGYESSRSRIHLVCRHCGERMPTDCAIPHAGGPPYRID